MAEQSAFLKAYDDMQKKKGGFNAPAPLESVIDTVGQAPEVQSPFGQQAGLDAISRTREVAPYSSKSEGSLPNSPRALDAMVARNPQWTDDDKTMLSRGANAYRRDDAFLAGPNPLVAPQPILSTQAGVAPEGKVATPQEPSSFNAPDIGLPSTGIGQVDPTTPFFQDPESQVNPMLAPQDLSSGGLTTAGGQPLAEFLAGGQQLDAQGRMVDPEVDRSSFNQASADREARQAARPDFGEAVSDRGRRAARGEGISDADRSDIAKANAQGPSASDIARGDKVAAANGIDRNTGKPLEGGQGVTSDLDKARTKKINAETAKVISDINSTNDTSNWDDGKKQAMKTQAKELAVWEINELPKLEKNISQLRAVSDALDLGQIKTGGLGDQIPGLSNWTRPFFNPDAEVARQEVSGVIMQTLKETFPGAISDGERKALIDTIFNPQLKPEDNAKLIIGYTDRLSKAMNAKVAQVKHFREFGNLEGYTGITPRDALMSGIPDTGAGGSPIEGDVNYQSDTQNKAQSLLGAQ